ncbi:hypothetical protein BGZ74_010246 [Mortierella antarctica]|nr:hypothetical protein BGZ74_010246 [Mortierella antarctica]
MAVKEASSDNILIRLAVAEDEQHIDLLHKVINDAYSSGGGWTMQKHLVQRDRISKDKLLGVINDQLNPLILAINEATLQPLGTLQLQVAETYPKFPPYTKIGHQSTHVETTPTENIIFLGLLSVEPLQQSRGIGRRLMDFGLTYTKDTLGRTHAVINALTQRPELIVWYKKLGFIDYGERVCYPNQSRTSHADVHFSVLRRNLR